jgi:structural maintenance of chromosome 2
MSRDLNTRCVTLDGDIHDPKGSLTGGFLNAAASILSKNEEVRKLKSDQESLNRELRELEENMARFKKDIDHKEGLRQDFEQKTHRLNLLKDKNKRNSNQGFEKKMNNMQEEREVYKENISVLKGRLADYEREIKELETDLKNSRPGSGSKKKSQKDMWSEKSKRLEAEMEKIQRDLKKTKEEIISLGVEKESSEADLKAAAIGIDKLKEKLKKVMYEKETQSLELEAVRKNKESCEVLNDYI